MLARMNRSVLASAALACGCVLLSGCGPDHGAAASGHTAPGYRTSAATMITIKDFAFHPDRLTVKPGERVSVRNEDSTPHTVTAMTKSQFDTGDINRGQTKRFTAPSKPGTYPYRCTIHPNMHGTLIVK
jgi:plastocyanin